MKKLKIPKSLEHLIQEFLNIDVEIDYYHKKQDMVFTKMRSISDELLIGPIVTETDKNVKLIGVYERDELEKDEYEDLMDDNTKFRDSFIRERLRKEKVNTIINLKKK